MAFAAEELAAGAEAPYWQGLLEGELRLQRCSECHTWHWPAVWRCSECGSWEQIWQPAPLQGHVFSWTRNWKTFGGLEGLETPYVSVLIKLSHESKTRLLGILEEDDTGLKIGASVIGTISTTTYAGQAYPALKWRLS